MKKILKISILLLMVFSTLAIAETARKQIVLIAGKKSHGPEGNGIHDYGWNIRLIKTMLENSNVKDQVEVSIFFNGWPKNAPVLSKADTIMIISDGRDGEKFEESLHLQNPEIINYVEKQTKRGCGLVTFHFSTFAPDANADQVLEWNGGYFDWETDGKRKWYSAIKTLNAEVKTVVPNHPISRGVKPFKMKEEFYYNIRFKENDSRLKSILEVPALKSKQALGNTVAWAVERKDGGRGFATTCGHFYKNWENENFRKTILNGLIWSAKIDIPDQGVEAKYFSRSEITNHLSKIDSIADNKNIPENFRTEKLVPWCLVPFDAKKRNPEQRAKMLLDLGLKRMAYDWRSQHVKEFEEEILAYKKHGIEYFAFWGFHPLMSKLIKKHKISPQIWLMLKEPKGIKDPKAKIEAAAKAVEARVKEAQELGCKVALYNHGGWAGEPTTMVSVTKWLREKGYDNIGIVYNFHHGHAHIKNFQTLFTQMKPYLFCLNINGMNDKARPKILTVSEGKHEKSMIQFVIDSGYTGPIGILDHLKNEDSHKVLKRNIEGLKKLIKQLPSKIENNSLKKEGAFIYKGDKIWRAPLKSESFPHWQQNVNRDRVYDFYAKQALYFGDKIEKLIPGFPGLDSGKETHWGNQNDKDTWTDGRANKIDFGSMVSGVIRGKGLSVTKGYSIHLQDDVYVIFDAGKNKFVKAWKGKQVSWSPVRFGLIKGLAYNKGEELKIDSNLERFKQYNGLYRVGKKVIFALDESFIEAVYENGKVNIKQVEKPSPASAQWSERIETKGRLGRGQPYVIDTLTLPYKNPWDALFFVGGIDVLSESRVAICTIHGDVWVCDIQNKDFSKLSWKRFASGLHQPLGLKVYKGLIHVTCRDQIVALHDLNKDDEADFYECVSNRFKTSPGGHDYVTGLKIDKDGRFYIASGNEGVCQIDEKGKSLKVLGSGLRNPNGLGINEDGSVALTSVQEGSWTPASAICDMSQGDHFGLGGPKAGKYVEPMLYLPRGIDNSSGGQTYINSKKWGPVNGQWVHFSMGFASHVLVLREVINGKSQSAALVLPGEFLSGAHRANFSPYDGQLYVAASQGWGNYGIEDGAVQRVRFVGGPYPYPSSYESRENGILLHFADPQPKEISDKKLWFAQHWNYRYSAAYGSKEHSVEEPMKEGHDRLNIKSIQYLDGGKKIFIEIPQIQPADQLHLYFNGETKLELFATIHNLGKSFTEFPGYEKVAKVYGKAVDQNAMSDPKVLIQACTACHHPTQKVVGPPFTELRKMYKDNPAGIVKWAKNPQVKNPQLPPMPSFSFMPEETLLKIANYILKETK